MSAAEAGATRMPDPTEKLREMRDAYLSIWSKSLIETVNSEGYAKASGAALDGILAVAAPLKEPTEQMMLKTLQQLNMPTSADFAGLAGRFTNMELLLDNLDAKLDRIEKLLPSLKTAAPEKQEVPTESAAPEAEVDQAEASAPEAAEASAPEATERVKAPATARKTTQAKQAALRASGTAKRTKTVKPVRRNPRKGIR